MKILILVCTSEKPPYDRFLIAQRETWASVPHGDIQTVFYCGSGNNEWDGDLFRSDCPHGYWTQHWKHKQAIDAVWDREWDIVFRTHSSSYVDKNRLHVVAKMLPFTGLYGGWTLGGLHMPLIDYNGVMVPQHCVSGAGIFYSRDIADVLRKNIPPGESMEEDVLNGRILHSLGYKITFEDKSRCDLRPDFRNYNPKAYHYRLKSDERSRDISNMYKLHKLINK